ncbi:uncharacterized protein LOC117652028 [Thrips palmi]|uniref:Uncharacterized protein LOC117652028 n=1 Tax=Thrips palmi TaxID=161013 RepID=A0A6P9A8C7_THRPL|nr:uncharacterized protein LOC117652028 [Thrips palmi]
MHQTLSASLAPWCWLFRIDGPKARLQRLWLLLLRSTGSLVLVAVTNLMLLAAVVQSSTLREATNGILMLSGVYSCSATQMFYRLRGERVANVLHDIQQVAVIVEANALPEGRKALANAARTNRRMVMVQLQFFFVLTGVVWVQVIATGEPKAPMWPALGPGRWGAWSSGVLQMIAMLVGCVSYFSLIALLGCATASLGGLYLALGGMIASPNQRSQKNP